MAFKMKGFSAFDKGHDKKSEAKADPKVGAKLAKEAKESKTTKTPSWYDGTYSSIIKNYPAAIAHIGKDIVKKIKGKK